MTTAVFEQVAVENRQDAFAALGDVVEPGTSPMDALIDADMTGWNVRKVPLIASIVEGEVFHDVAVPDKFAVIRDVRGQAEPQAFGVVGNYWTPFQNESTVQFISDLVDESHGHVARVGTLHGGRKTFVSIKLPQTMEFVSPHTGEKDVTELHLAIFNAHDGTGSVSGMITPIRLFCANQQRTAEATAKSRFSIRHTGDMKVKIEEVRAKLGIAFAYHETIEAEMQRMVAREMDNVEVFAVMNQVMGVQNAETDRSRAQRVRLAEDIFEVYKKSDTVANFRGTAFGAYNAVTEWADHYMTISAGGSDVRTRRATRTIEGGAVDNIKSAAFGLLVPA